MKRPSIAIAIVAATLVAVFAVLFSMKSKEGVSAPLPLGEKMIYPEQANALFKKNYQTKALQQCTKFILSAAKQKNTLFQNKAIDSSIRSVTDSEGPDQAFQNLDLSQKKFAKILSEHKNSYYEDCRKTYFEILFSCHHRLKEAPAIEQCFAKSSEGSLTVKELESSIQIRPPSVAELKPHPPAGPPKCEKITKDIWLGTYDQCISGTIGDATQLVKDRAVTARQLVTFCECMTTTITYDLSCEEDHKAQTDDLFSESLFQKRTKLCGSKAEYPDHPLLSDQ
jgi:hypothetical protein